jgi:hypothetical protein
VAFFKNSTPKHPRIRGLEFSKDIHNVLLVTDGALSETQIGDYAHFAQMRADGTCIELPYGAVDCTLLLSKKDRNWRLWQVTVRDLAFLEERDVTSLPDLVQRSFALTAEEMKLLEVRELKI